MAINKDRRARFGGRTVTAIIEFDEDKILLVKRGTVVFKGYWALPGGRVDAGESIEKAIVREVKEETGLNIEIIGKIGEYHEKGVKDDIEYDYYPACFLAKNIGGQIERQKTEIESIRLFSFKEMPNELAFEHSAMIQDYMRLKEMEKLAEEIRICKKCRLHKNRTNAVPGEGPANAEIMICGQAPGRNEGREGRPFVGMAGNFLNGLLESIELDRKNIFITSPIKCFPPKNRPPRKDELEACRPYLEKQIKIVQPKIIIALGNYALKTLLDDELSISKIHGIQKKRQDITVFLTFHPAAAMRFPKINALIKEDFNKLRELVSNLKQ